MAVILAQQGRASGARYSLNSTTSETSKHIAANQQILHRQPAAQLSHAPTQPPCTGRGAQRSHGKRRDLRESYFKSQTQQPPCTDRDTRRSHGQRRDLRESDFKSQTQQPPCAGRGTKRGHDQRRYQRKSNYKYQTQQPPCAGQGTRRQTMVNDVARI